MISWWKNAFTFPTGKIQSISRIDCSPMPVSLGLRVRPLIQFREHEAPVDRQPQAPYVLTVVEDQYEISSGIFPPLRLLLHGKGEFIIERKKNRAPALRARGNPWIHGDRRSVDPR